MPVNSGSVTGLRCETPGAMNLDVAAFGRQDRAFAVQRNAQRIDHAADDSRSDRHAQQPAGAFDFVPFLDAEIVAENDHADRALLQIEGQTDDAAGKLDHFAGHDTRQAVDARDAVAHFQHASDFADVDLRVIGFNFRLNDGSDLVGFEFHVHSC